MTVKNAFIPERLTEAREARGLTMTQLADIVGVSRAAVSQYEKGIHQPRINTTQQIAKTLNLPEHFFYKPVIFDKPPQVFFRKLTSLTKKDRTRSVRRISWLFSLVDFLEEYIEFMPVNIPDMNIGTNPSSISMDDIDAIADNVRKFYGIGLGPISDVTQLLENNGAIVSQDESESTGMDASSTISNSGRPFIITNPSMAARQRFNLAHELGHLVMHSKITPDTKNLKLIESQAHRFASAFLLPSKTYLSEFTTPSLSVFKSLKLRWGVSIAGQIYRCKDLNIVSDIKASQLWRKLNRFGWKRHEPFDEELAASENPKFLRDSVQLIIDSNIMSKQQLQHAIALGEKDIVQLSCLDDNYFEIANSAQQLTPRLKNKKVIEFRRHNFG